MFNVLDKDTLNVIGYICMLLFNGTFNYTTIIIIIIIIVIIIIIIIIIIDILYWTYHSGINLYIFM